VGEGPGRSEDVLGRPFAGKSGRYLREVFQEAGWDTSSLRVVLTNLVACRPCDSKASLNRTPTAMESYRCWPRLRQLLLASLPRTIVALGWCAFDILSPALPKIPVLKLPHPAHLLRQGGKHAAGHEEYVSRFREIGLEVLKEGNRGCS
jgi:uracil-DNA glycosylase